MIALSSFILFQCLVLRVNNSLITTIEAFTKLFVRVQVNDNDNDNENKKLVIVTIETTTRIHQTFIIISHKNSQTQQTKAKPPHMTDTFDLIVTAKEMGIRSKNVDGLCIDDISLKNFQGQTKQGYFLAHIYWAINYKFVSRSVPVSENYPMVVAQPSINPKSWMNRQCADCQLIQHEYGHYLISCWCALDFMHTVNYQYKILFKGLTVQEYKDWCAQVFRDKMKKYCALQRKYDEQTEHYCNQEEQKKWETKIVTNINQFDRKAKQMTKILQAKVENVRPISKQIKRNSNKSTAQSNSKRISASIHKRTAIAIKQIAPPAYRIRPSNFPLRPIKIAQ